MGSELVFGKVSLFLSTDKPAQLAQTSFRELLQTFWSLERLRGNSLRVIPYLLTNFWRWDLCLLVSCQEIVHQMQVYRLCGNSL